MDRSLRNVLLVAVAVVAAASVVRAVTPPFRDPNNPAHFQAGPIRDDYEYTIYLKRGAWAPTGMRPYLDVFSEYPPIATWCFGAPFLLVKAPAAPPPSRLAELDAALPNSPVALSYGNVWAGLMAIAWCLVAAATAQLALELGFAPARALLCLGPASLYCALQRFDPLPVLATSAALLAFARDRSGWGFAFLAAGAMLKIYPAFLAPLAFGHVARRRGWRDAWFGALAFAAVLVACHLPAFVAGWRDPAWHARWRPEKFAGLAVGPEEGASWRGGAAAVAVPYAYQGERDTNPGSFAERLFRVWLALPYEQVLGGVKAFRFAQLAPALLSFALGWWRPGARTLVAASAVVVTAFVLFHNIYSPQFQCWIVPLAAVAGGGGAGLVAWALCLAVDCVTYIQFPILGARRAFDPQTQRNVYPAGFETIVDARILLTAALLAVLAWLALRRPAEHQLSPERP